MAEFNPFVPLFDDPLAAGASRNTLQNAAAGRDPKAQGVFSSQPYATPKFLRHITDRHHEFEDTMARMFIRVPPGQYQKFLNSITDFETRSIAEKLTGGDDVKQGGVGYVDFLLHTANHAFEEKVQVVETLSDNYVAFFFGQSAPVFSYTGTLYNTFQDDWTMRMFRIYRDMARGTQLARRGFLLYLMYDSWIVRGSMLNLRWQQEAENSLSVPFSFSILVKKVDILYGGLTPPTDISKIAISFAPMGFNYLPETLALPKASQAQSPTTDNPPAASPAASAGYDWDESWSDLVGADLSTDSSGSGQNSSWQDKSVPPR